MPKITSEKENFNIETQKKTITWSTSDFLMLKLSFNYTFLCLW